jgi:anti-sigma regulatory factor (Ser/Thr protein kinase)
VQLTFHRKAVDRRQLARALEDYCRENQVPAKVYQAADLALEEHLTNVLNYSFAAEEAHEIVIRFSLTKGCLQVEVEDNGKPYNPLDAPEVDTTVRLEDKPVGGLGIHLMRKFMDELSYRHEAGRNILSMAKRLEAA